MPVNDRQECLSPWPRMTREQFDEFVGGIERRLGARPLALRLWIALIVALGYGVFLFWFLLVFLIGMLFFLGAVAVDTVPGLVLLAAGSLLLTLGGIQAVALFWIAVKLPPGRVLSPREAVDVFAILERLRVASRSPRFPQVRITPEFNASVRTIPRLGVFGWPRYILDLGLPLMEALSPGECEAVLAHEVAHWSRRHGRFGAWICRLRATWDRAFQQLHQPANSQTARTLQKLLWKFLDWYWPRFNGYAFVLSRANEYAADCFAADWAGSEIMASALWRIACHSLRLDEQFWPNMEQQANVQEMPPADVTAQMAAFLAQPAPPADASRWMQQVALRLTDYLDTHPSLSDRLRAIGQSTETWHSAGLPSVAQPSAAVVVLGEQRETIARDVDSLWQKQIEETWRARHVRAISLQHRLTTLEGAPREPESGPHQLWERAQTTLDLHGPTAAEPLLRQLVAVQPTHSAANLILGRILLDRGDVEGEQFLRKVLEKEEDELLPAACDTLAQYHRLSGESDRVREVHQRLSRFQAAAAAANRERSTITASDRFVPHDLSAVELSDLQCLLSAQPDLASAYLARKELIHFPGQRLFVLCVRSSAGFWSWSRSERDTAVVSGLAARVTLPGRLLVVAPRTGFRAVGRKIVAVGNAQVYPVPLAAPCKPPQ
jgi:Zn-dependent protease with chaperone function